MGSGGESAHDESGRCQKCFSRRGWRTNRAHEKHHRQDENVHGRRSDGRRRPPGGGVHIRVSTEGRKETHAQESNKKHAAYPKQYLATAHEIARRIGEKQAGTVNSRFTVIMILKMSITEDLMGGEDPLVVESTSGFQLKVEKRHVDDVSGETIENEGTSITLPSSCVLLGRPKDCRAARAAGSETESSSVGLVVVKWSNILETEGTEGVSLSAESNTLDFSLTNRAGNTTLKLRDTPEPFEVCLGMSQSSGDSAGSRLRHVAPSFGDKDDFLVYHQLTIDKSGAAVKVEFVPDEKSSSFVFFYGVGYKPSLLVYDGRVFLADLQAEGGRQRDNPL
ncbi:hypothetical protein AVEN_51294-1 [Araneus ventricosus]|uniref:Uncharacterized protein n=1 Tax=Araneus ventricosus TaxID=182803 RepID=A0A4Y2MCG9_ARAVE|nr:hypothetical protein AVEN_51294-1 [Araneus ventricosus]